MSPAHEAQHAVTEAAIAWRQGHRVAAELAVRGARVYARLGYPDGQGLALGLAVAAGAEVDPAEVLALVRTMRDGTLALQALALGAPRSAAGLPVPDWLAGWHLPEPGARADVLSLDECSDRVRA